MKIYSAVSLLMFLLISCSKDDAPIPSFGIWIEQSLRLDTLDFAAGNTFGTVNNSKTVYFKCKPFTDITLNPNYPINNSTFYSYYFKSDSLFLLNFLSSSTIFQRYKFQMAANQQTFEVARFYTRNQLPATLTFEKIK